MERDLDYIKMIEKEFEIEIKKIYEDAEFSFEYEPYEFCFHPGSITKKNIEKKMFKNFIESEHFVFYSVGEQSFKQVIDKKNETNKIMVGYDVFRFGSKHDIRYRVVWKVNYYVNNDIIIVFGMDSYLQTKTKGFPIFNRLTIYFKVADNYIYNGVVIYSKDNFAYNSSLKNIYTLKKLGNNRLIIKLMNIETEKEYICFVENSVKAIIFNNQQGVVR